MLQSNKRIIRHKVGLLNLAEELGNVSQACKVMGLSRDTFCAGILKGVGRIYQQTFVDTYSKVACAKLYTTKTPITAADLLNDRILPLFPEQELPMCPE